VAAPLAASERTLVAGGASGRVVVRDEGGAVRISDARGSRTVELGRGEWVDSVATFGEDWLLAGVRADAATARIVLRRVTAGGEPIELAAPATERRLQRDPQLVVAPRAAAPSGLAWLEGDRPGGYAIRYAAWDGTSFVDPLTIAGRPSSGSNLALSAATLSDGRTLLVWAGYDGSDDEIWAAVGRGSEWTAPFRVAADNAVPDITPVALATSQGALVAWSRFDGSEYRLAIAHFDGRAFGSAAWAAPRGSVFPSVARRDDGSAAGIVYRDARTSGWGVVEVGASGRTGRVALLAETGEERPVARLDDSGARWELADRSTASPWE